MASETGPAATDLARALTEEPSGFDFFQAVRLMLREHGWRPGEAFPRALRIRPDLGLDYPESDIAAVNFDEDGNCEITTTFLGLYGVSSPLPSYYSEELLDEEWESEHSVRGFLDISHYQLFPLLYAAWLKHRFADNAIELGRDEYWDVLFSLVGLRDPELRAGVDHPGRFLRYLGLLSQQPRSAIGLEAIVGDLLHPIAVELVPCVPRWVRLPVRERTRLGEGAELGASTVVGMQMEDRSGRFQLCFGPLSGGDFQTLVNDHERMRFLRRLVGYYLVQPLECELVFEITGESVLPARLGGEAWSRLGEDAWLRSAEESPPVSVRMTL